MNSRSNAAGSSIVMLPCSVDGKCALAGATCYLCVGQCVTRQVVIGRNDSANSGARNGVLIDVERPRLS